MTKIALLVPTRGRPEQCRRMVESAINTSTHPLDVHLGIQDTMYDHVYASRSSVSVNKFPMLDWPTVMTWNWLAQETIKQFTDTNLFMLAADDMIFATPGWDTALIDHYEGLKEKCHVYHLQDSRDIDGTPHPIVSREYIAALGYFLPPIFLHWYVDSWTRDIAKSNGVFTYMRDYQLRHEKGSDIGNPDETHKRIRRAGWHERDKYVNDTCQHFLEAEKKRLDDVLRSRERKEYAYD